MGKHINAKAFGIEKGGGCSGMDQNNLFTSGRQRLVLCLSVVLKTQSSVPD